MKRQAAGPPTLPRVHIVVGRDERLSATIDGVPFPVPPAWASRGMDAVAHVMSLTVTGLGRVARVDLTMPDGSTVSEILTPEEAAQADDHAPEADVAYVPVPTSAGGSFLGVAEVGFRPGERVSVAVVVASSVASREGVAALRLPPGLLGREPFAMVLLGHDSGYVVVHDPTDTPAPAAAPGGTVFQAGAA